ncbi:hypothetical protein [Arthrobacter sp. SD76]
MKILVDGEFQGPLTIEYGGFDGADAEDAINKTIELIRAAVPASAHPPQT